MSHSTSVEKTLALSHEDTVIRALTERIQDLEREARAREVDFASRSKRYERAIEVKDRISDRRKRTIDRLQQALITVQRLVPYDEQVRDIVNEAILKSGKASDENENERYAQKMGYSVTLSSVPGGIPDGPFLGNIGDLTKTPLPVQPANTRRCGEVKSPDSGRE